MIRPRLPSGPVGTPPKSDKADGEVGRVGEQESSESLDCRATPLSGQALRAIDGEGRPATYLARLQARQANPDELAVIVSMLYGAALRGFCRTIEKAIGRGQGGSHG